MRKVNKILRYIYVPVLFAVIGYMIIYIALTPVFSIAKSVGGMIISDRAPNFNKELSVIYDPEAHKEVETTVNNSVPISAIEQPRTGAVYANISCDAIGMNESIYWGDSNAILDVGIGQYTGSYMPGYGRTMLICGHRSTFGRYIKYTEVGNVYKVTTNYGVYEYEVTDIKIMTAAEAESQVSAWLLQKDEEQLIYYTCYPFESGYGKATQRCFVFAKKISGPEVE